MNTTTDFNIAIRFDSEFPVDLRELHQELESGQKFTDWAKVKLSIFKERRDYFLLPNVTKQKKQGGHNRIDYAVTVDTAKHIAMTENTERGYEVRQYFIDIEKAFRQQSAVLHTLSGNPVAAAILEKVHTFQVQTESDVQTLRALSVLFDDLNRPANAPVKHIERPTTPITQKVPPLKAHKVLPGFIRAYFEPAAEKADVPISTIKEAFKAYCRSHNAEDPRQSPRDYVRAILTEFPDMVHDYDRISRKKDAKITLNGGFLGADLAGSQ